MLPRFKDRSAVLMFRPKGRTYGQKNPFSANSPEKLMEELKEVFSQLYSILVGCGSTRIPRRMYRKENVHNIE